TIAAVAGQNIRQKAGNLPVLDVISAGAEAALQTPKNNRIGIIATNTTVNSNAYARAIQSKNNDTLVRTQAAPLLVPLVEEGWL
ncbi:glutamate racemase, partial [Neisseria sp. P0001.S010]